MGENAHICESCGLEYGGAFCGEDDGLCAPCHKYFPNGLKEFTPYFDTGLGVYVRTRGDRLRKMREMGMEEVGNELEAFRKLSAGGRQPVCSVDEVAEKLTEIRHRMKHDPSYRRKYGAD